MKKIGFIGTGVMGRSMAGHLLQAGHPLIVYTRTRAKAEPLLEAGAEWADTPAALAMQADVIITMVGYPEDVRSLYLEPEGLIAHARSGTFLIDMTTSDPRLAVEIAEAARSRALHALDAPVSGGDIGAREARLTIMAGGERADFDAVLPVLRVMGGNIMLQGGAGSGQHTKMVNQIAIAAGMVGMCEAIAYARRAGLNPEQVLECISGGAAGSWSLSNYGPRILKGDFEPGFYVKHFIKDMRIALESARAMQLETPGLALAERLYSQLADEGGGDLGTQALYRIIDTQREGGT